MSNENILNVSANDGKYTVIVDCEHRPRVLRYGEPWPAFEVTAPDNLTMALAWDLDEARAKIESLIGDVSRLERLRPHWAQGYTSDSMAAQCKTSALDEIWLLLGASNQTEAMGKLREIVGDNNNKTRGD